MNDYMIYYRCFVGPGYWGRYKFTRAYNDEHAQQKLERIQLAYNRKPHKYEGEFKIERYEKPSWHCRCG